MSDRYGTIIADPPWAYRNSGGGSVRGTAASQYETASVADICALGPWVDSVAADKSVLLLWCTWPQAQEGLAVMDAWGFDYVTGFPWVKTAADGVTPRRGVGFWSQGCSEFVFIGRRGGVSPGRTGTLGLLCGSDRQFWAPRGKHSRKPDDLHAYAETHLPGPYLEMFARRQRDGWTCLGGDLGTWLTPQGVQAVRQ